MFLHHLCSFSCLIFICTRKLSSFISLFSYHYFSWIRKKGFFIHFLFFMLTLILWMNEFCKVYVRWWKETKKFNEGWISGGFLMRSEFVLLLFKLHKSHFNEWDPWLKKILFKKSKKKVTWHKQQIPHWFSLAI